MNREQNHSQRAKFVSTLVDDTKMSEFEALDRFLQANWAETVASGLPYRYDHVGDLWWGIYTARYFDPTAELKVWKTGAGEIAAFALVESDVMTTQIGLNYRDDAGLVDEIVAWGADKVKRNGKDSLWMKAFEHDDAMTEALLSRGFERDPDGFYTNFHQRSLLEPLPDYPVREGWSVRNVFLEHEMAERVDVHRDAFAPSRMTLELYRRIRNAPRYNPGLDLVLVTPQNSFAAFCICWLDQANKVGEFEPVGVREAHQGKGFARQVMAEGLRRLKARGAETAIVYSTSGNPAATRLYESLGMAVVDRAWLYGKQV